MCPHSLLRSPSYQTTQVIYVFFSDFCFPSRLRKRLLSVCSTACGDIVAKQPARTSSTNNARIPSVPSAQLSRYALGMCLISINVPAKTRTTYFPEDALGAETAETREGGTCSNTTSGNPKIPETVLARAKTSLTARRRSTSSPKCDEFVRGSAIARHRVFEYLVIILRNPPLLSKIQCKQEISEVVVYSHFVFDYCVTFTFTNALTPTD